MQVITVGRSEENDRVITDPCTSRHHLQIIQHDDGHFTLSDFGSTNGTYVNGQKINGEIQLNDTDIVRIGNTTIPWRMYFDSDKQYSSSNDSSSTLDEPPSGLIKKKQPKKKVLFLITCILAIPVGIRFIIKGLQLIRIGEDFMLTGILQLVSGGVLIILSIMYVIIIFGKKS